MLQLILLFYSFVTNEPKPGLFREQTIDSLVSIGYGIAIGDVDGDKKQDILLADKSQVVWYRNGDWKKFIMAENLTEFDNVCIAARDLDGDGKVEVAVGAQWNPSETSDSTKSGSVHYLVRPSNLTDKWSAVTLRHEPTVHRMRWVKIGGKYHLVVLPLHGRNNKGGEGAGVKVFAYEFPGDVNGEWKMKLLADDMHMTHNFTVQEEKSATKIYIAGKEGVKLVSAPGPASTNSEGIEGMNHAAGEIKTGRDGMVTIEPMHGNNLVFYTGTSNMKRTLLDSTLKEGHALGIADFDGDRDEEVVAGWRNPDTQQQVGVRLYSRQSDGKWTSEWIDKNGMACEDLQVADLNDDGKPDIVASGRATKNVKIYWNNSRR